MTTPLFTEHNGIWVARWPIQKGSKQGVEYVDSIQSVNIFGITASFPLSRTIQLAPQGIGGNHTHERQEIYVPLSQGLELHWMHNEQLYSIMLNLGGAYYMPSNVPHAMKNTSSQPALFVEYIDKEAGSTPYLLI